MLRISKNDKNTKKECASVPLCAICLQFFLGVLKLLLEMRSIYQSSNALYDTCHTRIGVSNFGSVKTKLLDRLEFLN